MLELIAQGPTVDHRWRRTLPATTVELGRATEAYRVPWDSKVSRKHVRLTSGEHRVHVEVLPEASNPVFFDGREQADFHVRPGEHFVIGNTTFMLASDQAFGSMSAPDPIRQRTFSADFLQEVTYRDADRRIEVLNRLPELIANASDSNELLIGMVNTLMAGIVSATTIGVVRRQADISREDSQAGLNSRLKIIHWDRRKLVRGDFQPSEKLIAQSLELGQSVLNVWQSSSTSEAAAASDDHYTFDYENDWAFACPIENEATDGWAIYVAGSNRGPDGSDSIEESDLDGDIKFCELVGATLKSLLRVKQLERQQASLRTFFSPLVVDALRGQDAETVLAPRKCEVSVLFCDLRGFSKTSERMSGDLLGLLSRVSDSLGVTTGEILDAGGVIGDFHGDAVMGFWGWPLEKSRPAESAAAAVRAALQIQSALGRIAAEDSQLKNFTMGLGIASGEAVAGKIGTRDQVKVTAFGPVVNLAARLESMTSRLGSPILVDAETVSRIQNSTSNSASDALSIQSRRLGKFQPFGMEKLADVFQVFETDSFDADQIAGYAAALKLFETGEWPAASRQLQSLDSSDAAVSFLLGQINGGEPPANFKGVIRMAGK
jgi:adenylate cyclase